MTETENTTKNRTPFGASVEQLLASVADQVAMSADRLQDRLLDLWGELPEGAARSELERWITETLSRSLYVVEDVKVRLAEIEQLVSPESVL